MKQLILTFFAAILCYSLFFDKSEKTEKATDATLSNMATMTNAESVQRNTVFDGAMRFELPFIYTPAGVGYIFSPTLTASR